MNPFCIGDIVLDNVEARLHGLELVSHYFEACPQALVFLLTSLDVESLVGSGDVNWRYVDAILSKDATETLAYEYRHCFRERFGGMFWMDWGSELKLEQRRRCFTVCSVSVKPLNGGRRRDSGGGVYLKPQ